mgnify:CR=1 FL=1
MGDLFNWAKKQQAAKTVEEAPDVLASVSTLTTKDKKRLKTARERVQDLMRDQQWHANHEITHPDVGGSEGMRRLRELRKTWDGWIIQKKRHGDGRGTWLYRATPCDLPW